MVKSSDLPVCRGTGRQDWRGYLAERDLRMSKVKQKVSGAQAFAKAYCRISSYLQTMADKGYNPLVAIQMAFSGQIYTQPGE